MNYTFLIEISYEFKSTCGIIDINTTLQHKLNDVESHRIYSNERQLLNNRILIRDRRKMNFAEVALFESAIPYSNVGKESYCYF